MRIATTERSSPTFLFIATACVGMMAAAWTGALDVAVNMPDERAAFGLASWLLWLAFAAPLMPLTALAVTLLMWPLRTRLSPPMFVGLLIGSALQAQTLLFLSTPAAVLSVAPIWIIALLIAQVEDLRRPAFLMCLTAAAIVAAGATMLIVFALRPPPAAWLSFATLAIVGACWSTRRAEARRPRLTSAVLAAAVLVLVLLCLGVNMAALDHPPSAGALVHHAAQPNVVLIVLDTTRRDHLGSYGGTGNLTPNLDRIAAAATVYDQAISPADWTAPSHASLFTGLYPPTHGVSFGQHRWLDEHFTTLAEMLRSEGFQTVALVANRYIGMTNLQQGFDHYVLTWNDRGSYIGTAAQLLGFPSQWVDKGASRSVVEIQDWLAHDYDPEHPVFLFVNLLESHWRYLPPAGPRAQTLPADVPYWQATRVSTGFHPIHWLAGQPHSIEGERAIRGLYAAEVAYQDQELGRFLDVLQQRLDPQHTLLIITADHGENLGEGGRWDHTFAVDDHLVHVPLIIRYPNGDDAGRRVAGQCQSIDIVPTVFAVLGRPVPVPGLPGRTLLPQQFQPRDVSFSESVPFFDHAQRLSGITGMRRDIARFTHVLHAARTTQFKYVASSDGTSALYDLGSDPDETRDVSQAHPEITADLRARLGAWERDVPKYAPQTQDSAAEPTGSHAVSDSERERLRQLGYMQ